MIMILTRSKVFEIETSSQSLAEFPFSM
uniref:Uncharacterized protein n=1 Tax=Arundo donax TaxID=35708 RepID=A0A0A9GWU8_ARUDO